MADIFHEADTERGPPKINGRADVLHVFCQNLARARSDITRVSYQAEAPHATQHDSKQRQRRCHDYSRSQIVGRETEEQPARAPAHSSFACLRIGTSIERQTAV